MASDESPASRQTRLPGTTPYIGHYECGHGRTHSIPEDDVRLLKVGSGFEAVCTCGGHSLAEAAEPPHVLGPHRVLVGGVDLDPAMWLALDEVADGWLHSDPDDPGYQDESPRERRAAHRRECEAAVEGDETAPANSEPA